MQAYAEDRDNMEERSIYIEELDPTFLYTGKGYRLKDEDAIVDKTENPFIEFFVAFTDVRFGQFEPNEIPMPGDMPIIHTKGELRQKIFKICASMEAENAVCRQGRYFMMKAYLMQLLLLLVREQTEPVEVKNGKAFESANKKYVVEQIVSYFEDHYAEKISLDQIAENMYLSPFYVSRIFRYKDYDV